MSAENHLSEKSVSLNSNSNLCLVKNVKFVSEVSQVKTSSCFNSHLASNGLPLSTAFSDSSLRNVDVHDSPSYETAAS